MPELDINSIGAFGLLKDVPGYQLPPELFTTALNMRFDDDGVKLAPFWESAFTPSVAPYFVWSVQTPSLETWYIYASLTAVYVFDASTHTDITRSVGGAYAATAARDWNSCLLGGVPIINNGVDDPQFWSAYSTGTPLADLTNWPANTSAKLIRALGPNLVALNVTESGTQYPNLVWWSHPADPGGVPSSWDYTDDAVDAGRTDITSARAGQITEALLQRDDLIVYLDDSTWRMRRVGGSFIFQFDQLFTNFGCLATRCAGQLHDGVRHFVVTEDDIVVHDGREVRSVLDRRMRHAVFSALSTSTFRNSFVFSHPNEQEMWFCYPETGESRPTRALVWGYGTGGPEGVLWEAEVNFDCATFGDLAVADTTWDSDSGTWDADTEVWDVSDRLRVIVGNATDSEVYKLESGTDRNGSGFTGTLAREGLPFYGRRRTGEPLVDFRRYKFVRRVWIKAEGEPFNVKLGVADYPQGSITWSNSKTFTPATDDYVDFAASGSLISIEFTGTSSFKIFGYTIEMMPAGRFP